MSKPICSLLVLNLKGVTRILANTILYPKKSNTVQFNNINQLKIALKLQEGNQIEIKTEIPAEVMKQLDSSFIEQPVIPVVEEVKPEPEKEPEPAEKAPEPAKEEVVVPEEEEPKPKRKKKNPSSEQ